MKLLDRYVLVSFLKNYAISFMVLIGLYIVLDMVVNFDELAAAAPRDIQHQLGAVDSAATLLRSLVDYYFFQCFLIFGHLSGIIPVVAATFTLMRMQRFNELTASLAAGVPLLRTAVPVIAAALVLSVLLIVDQELLIPNMIPKLTRSHNQVAAAVATKSYPIRAMQDDANGLVNASLFHPPASDTPGWMEVFDVIQHDGSFVAVGHIRADRADWDPVRRQWRLTGGRVITGLRPGEKLTEQPCDVYKSNVTPDEVALFRSGEFVELLSTPRINQLIQRPKSYGTIDLLRVKHARLTQWMVNLIMLLLAVASILTREPGRLRIGLLQCSILSGACMAAIFVSQQVAGTPPGPQWLDTWPAIMAWVPIMIFLPVAVWLLDRVKT